MISEKLNIKNAGVAASLIAFLTAGFGTDIAFPQPAYKTVDLKDGGSISGVVRLQGDVPKSFTFEIMKDNDWCGRKKSSPRLALGKNNVVRNSVISLEDISQGKKIIAGVKYVLDQRKCEYTPHMMILPAGSDLEIVNSDPILHNVHAYFGQSEPQTVFNIAQPIKGFRLPIKSKQFKSPGIYSATCDAGHPWMSAFIVVAEHPYYAVTDAEGKFELKDVPPGMYKVKMWHEGVNVTRVEMENGKPKLYQFEKPYEEAREVTVPAKGSITVDFNLMLRSETLTKQ